MSQVVPLWFLFLLIGNFAVTLAYALWNRFYRRDASGSWKICARIMLLCPVTGVCCFLLSWLLFRLVFRAEVDLSDVVFSKERVQAATKADEEAERNVVPLEEALAVTDKRHLRELMMNILRDDYRDSLSSIALALNSSDSETAHYAASVLQDVLNDFRIKLQKDYQKIMDALDETDGEDNPAGAGAPALIKFMDDMLQKRVFTQLEQTHYTHLMEEMGEKLYHRQTYSIDCDLLERIALRLLEIQDFQLCEKWCLRIVELYPDTLSAYTTRLKLYFSSGERENFFNVMEGLKKTDIVIDRETLELIRAFS